MTTERITARWLLGRVRVASLLAVAASAAFLSPAQPPANSRVFIDTVPIMRRVPIMTTWVGIEETASKEIERAFYGQVSVAEAATTAVSLAQPYFDRAAPGFRFEVASAAVYFDATARGAGLELASDVAEGQPAARASNHHVSVHIVDLDRASARDHFDVEGNDDRCRGIAVAHHPAGRWLRRRSGCGCGCLGSGGDSLGVARR